MLKLFIVESPGKIKTIQNILPKEFVVCATIGHCYQIERTNTGIDTENKYTPKYVVSPGKQKVVSEIRKISLEADEVYIATDNDREGEGIGTHIADFVIKDPKKIKRVIFREITKSAILKSIENPISLDRNMYDAQQARCVLDMLVGFKVSPILWKKVRTGTSAGRVQSIGLRFIVERQREIDSFIPKEYWTISGQFKTIKKEILKALYHYNGELSNGIIAKQLEDEIQTLSDWYIDSITEVIKTKSPYAIFNTSSLQQFASSYFNWDGKLTMALAQKLYEGGHITYHRTDSFNISDEALLNVRSFIVDNYGKQYCPLKSREFKSKNKVVQEAHEGIRPTHLEKTLDEIKLCTKEQEFKLYEAIYSRFLACQMSDAEMNSSKIVIKSESSKHEFITNGQIIKFEGYLKIWKKYSSTKDEELPIINKNEKLVLKEVKSEQHFTKPLAFYNTASLVKILEEEGIGRPSTYAGIIDTLIKREYVEKDGKSFKSTELGCIVSDFLVKNFPEIMDKKYTARIEDQLDDIANGDKVWHEVVHDFFKEIRKRVADSYNIESLKKCEITNILCPVCKKNMLVKRDGKYGDFYGCLGFLVRGKEKCKVTFTIGENGEPILVEKKPVRYLENILCDKCGSKIIIRTSSRTGKEFGGCSKFPKCRNLYSMQGENIKKSKKITEEN